MICPSRRASRKITAHSTKMIFSYCFSFFAHSFELSSIAKEGDCFALIGNFIYNFKVRHLRHHFFGRQMV